MEERWRALARNYELSESLSTFANDLFRGRPKRQGSGMVGRDVHCIKTAFSFSFE